MKKQSEKCVKTSAYQGFGHFSNDIFRFSECKYRIFFSNNRIFT